MRTKDAIKDQLSSLSGTESGVNRLTYGGDVAKALLYGVTESVTWNGVGWKKIDSEDKTCDRNKKGRDTLKYRINSGCGDVNVERLLRLVYELNFSNIDLVNTAVPVPVTVTYETTTEGEPPVTTTTTSNLYYYRSDGTGGLINNVLYISDLATLSTFLEGQDIVGEVEELVSYTPRHQVMWTPFAGIAALNRAKIEYRTCSGECVEEELDRNLQLFEMAARTKPGHRDSMLYKASSLNLGRVRAAIGNDKPSMLGSPSLSDRVTYTDLMFSFADSNQENTRFKRSSADIGKHHTHLTLDFVNDLRELLIFEEEQMNDVSGLQFQFIVPSATPSSITVNGVDVTVTVPPSNPPLASMSELNVKYIQSTDEFFAIDKTDVDYSAWIAQSQLKPVVDLIAQVGIFSGSESVKYGQDSVSVNHLYRHMYRNHIRKAKPATTDTLDFDSMDGLLQYGWVAARNENSRRQGFFFNFTNDTSYVYHRSDDGIDHVDFTGNTAISELRVKVNDIETVDEHSKFFETITPLPANSSPIKGVLMAPVYSLFIGPNNELSVSYDLNHNAKVKIRVHLLGSGIDEYKGGDSTTEFRIMGYLLSVCDYQK